MKWILILMVFGFSISAFSQAERKHIRSGNKDFEKEIIKKAHETWAGSYFNEYQYLFLYVVGISICIKFFFSKFKIQFHKKRRKYVNTTSN